MFKYKNGELERQQTRNTMLLCLQAELKLGRPLTEQEIETQYINTVAEVKAMGNPIKSSAVMIVICLLGSWAGVFALALIAGYVNN